MAQSGKGQAVKQAALDVVRDWVALTLAGLGISFAAHQYFGGLLLAMAGAAIARRADPERDERELWLVVLTAFVAAHVAAVGVSRYLPDIPVQLAMAAAGFFSRFGVRLALRLAATVEGRSEQIVDRALDVVLPDRDDDDDHKRGGRP